jgi:hypothetical protein
MRGSGEREMELGMGWLLLVQGVVEEGDGGELCWSACCVQAFHAVNTPEGIR